MLCHLTKIIYSLILCDRLEIFYLVCFISRNSTITLMFMLEIYIYILLKYNTVH